MNAAEIKLDLFRKIDALNDKKLNQVYEYMLSFFKSKPKKDGKAGLIKLSGSMSAHEAKEMLKTIEDDCEKIDYNEW